MVKSKVKLVTLDFDYDREQWVKIEECICEIRSGGLSEEERARLRKAATEYLWAKRRRESGNYLSTKRKALLWKKIARMCDELRNEIENALEHRYEANWRDNLDLQVHPLKYGDADLTFSTALQVLAELRSGAEEFSNSFWWGVFITWTATGRLDPPVIYLQSILWMWKNLGGELKISRHPNSGQIGGPLARYIDAVAVPVMGQDAPSPNSYRSLINRQKAFHRRLEEVKRIDPLDRIFSLIGKKRSTDD